MKTKLISVPFRGIAVTHKIQDDAILRNIKNIQQEIQKHTESDIKMYRRSELHITLFDHTGEWTKFPEYRTAEEALELTEIASKYQHAFSVSFDYYKMTKTAVILASHEAGEFNDMRKSVFDIGKSWNIFDVSRPLYPDIVHTTICRFDEDTSDCDKAEISRIIRKYNSRYIELEPVRGFNVREFSRPLDYSSGHNVGYVGLEQNHLAHRAGDSK